MTLIPPASLVRDHLQRIERSASFARADRLRGFLRFVVEKTLAGEQDAIKEYLIAVEVCGRDPSFDPKADPIVRVDANRLRARLDAYYRFEGQGDRVRIQLRKGTYVPAITLVESAVPRPHGAALVVLPFVNLGSPREDVVRRRFDRGIDPSAQSPATAASHRADLGVPVPRPRR